MPKLDDLMKLAQLEQLRSGPQQNQQQAAMSMMMQLLGMNQNKEMEQSRLQQSSDQFDATNQAREREFVAKTAADEAARAALAEHQQAMAKAQMFQTSVGSQGIDWSQLEKYRPMFEQMGYTLPPVAPGGTQPYDMDAGKDAAQGLAQQNAVKNLFTLDNPMTRAVFPFNLLSAGNDVRKLITN